MALGVHRAAALARIGFAALATLAAACSPELGIAKGAPPAQAALECAEPDPPDAGPEDAGAAGTGSVVIVSVDGLRADAVAAAPADALIDLACRGAYTMTARTILPPLTLPAHASMVSGYQPEQHGLEHDSMQPGYIEVPTVFGLAEAAGLEAVIVVGKQKLVQLAPPGSYDYFEWVTGGDAAVVDAAIAATADGFDVLFVHLPAVDWAGHSSGWMSADYLAQVRAADDEVARLVDALPAGTTVIVTADHGGHDSTHGADLPTDTMIPWIVAGPGVRERHVIGAPVSVMDTAATAALVAGFALEPDAIGRPVAEAFAD